jgi:hypothetical protein
MWRTAQETPLFLIIPAQLVLLVVMDVASHVPGLDLLQILVLGAAAAVAWALVVRLSAQLLRGVVVGLLTGGLVT